MKCFTPLLAFACSLVFSTALVAEEPAPAKVAIDSKKTLKLKVDGMNCQGCVSYLTTYLKKIDGFGESYISLDHDTVVVIETKETALSEAFLTETVKEAGYELKKVERTAQPLAEVKAALEAEEPAAES